jgi:YD repeat-containing protein
VFRKLLLCLSLGACVLSLAGRAQTGLYPHGSFDNVGMDTIDRGSLNVHFAIPVVNKAGRGLGFSYQLVYDSLVWSPVNAAGIPGWTPLTGFGLRGQLNDGLVGYVSYAQTTIKCYQQGGGFVWDYTNQHYVYHDSVGGSHAFAYAYNDCTGAATGAGVSSDGSGYSFDGDVLTSPDGKQITPPFNSQTSSATMIDTNGNYISNHGDGTFTDTLGKTALNITGSGNASSPRYFTYSTPTGTAQVVVTYKTYAVQTVFGCSNVAEYNLSQDLVDKITLADGSIYQFAYEKTPNNPSNVTGRLAQLTLPQGGVIAYQYTGANNGIVCADGTPAGLTRTGGVSRTYTRSPITAITSHTDVIDGLNNTSNYDFVMAGSPEAFFETKRTVNQGSNTVLLSRQTCYNNSGSSCTTTAITLPISQIDTYETLNGLQHGSTLTYNTFGLLTSETDYDFSTSTNTHGSPLRNETWTYPTTGIANLLSADLVGDGTTQIGKTLYSYDETTGTGHAAVSPTSGLPQHTAVTGQRGNLTTIKQYPGTAATPISTAAAYEDTGNALSVTGPTGQSTYAFDAPTHGFAITSTPPTPSSGVSLPSSATHDANSGVQLTAVDPNTRAVTYTSYDPRMRPTEIDYPDGGRMIASYTANQTGVYQYMTGSTHTNTQTNFDSYGRFNWVAVQNASGGYYWNNDCYDANGNIQYAAYRFTSGSIACSGAGDSYTYDALGRVLTIRHGDNSTITYAYTGRATQVTDENGVSRIVQVDGLGRTTAVCEISGSTLQGESPIVCSLDRGGTGFKTTYAYSTDTTAGNALKTTVTSVSPSQQTRIFETDWLGRTTLVTEPESGATTYSYVYNTGSGLGLTVTRKRGKANQANPSILTTTTTQNDSLGRVVSVTYDDGTPTITLA